MPQLLPKCRVSVKIEIKRIKGARVTVRFFVDSSDISYNAVTLRGDDARHAKVLRLRPGERFVVCDGQGTDYLCDYTSGDGQIARAAVIGSEPSRGEPTVDCTVYLALSKGDKLDFAVAKCVELGVSGIVLFPSERMVVSPEIAALEKKRARLERIAEESAKQSGRGKVPNVTSAKTYAEAISSAATAELSLFCYENEQNLGLSEALKRKLKVSPVSIVTGPEGGFTREEVTCALNHGMDVVTMGSRILRCETAPICAVSAVMFFTGNLD